MTRKRSAPAGRSKRPAIVPTESDGDRSTRLPPATTDRWDWQLRAACRGMDSAFFFPPEHELARARNDRISRAKAVCAGCPALLECRDFALANSEPFGVWGGLSEHERLPVRARSSPGF